MRNSFSGLKSTWFSICYRLVRGLKRVTVAILEWLVMSEGWPPLFPLDPPAALEPVCWPEMPPAPLTMALATPWARTCFPPITLETEGFPFATRICPLLIATCLTADWSVELTGIPTIWRWERHQMTHDCVHRWQLNDCWASALCFIGKPQTDGPFHLSHPWPLLPVSGPTWRSCDLPSLRQTGALPKLQVAAGWLLWKPSAAAAVLKLPLAPAW